MTDGPWYAPGLGFTCTRCGSCCSGPPGCVWMTHQEARAIADRLGLPLEAFLGRYAREHAGRWSLKDELTPEGYDCVLLMRGGNGATQCSVYDVRPSQCRTWPFWPENLRSPRHWRAAGRRCPGVAAGLDGAGAFVAAERIGVIRDSHPAD